MRKKLLLIIGGTASLVIVGLLMLTGAYFLAHRDNSPPFRQAASEVTKIELYINSKTNATQILQLDDAEAREFMEKLYQLKCYKHFSPTGDIGTYEIRIYYAADNADVIGSRANGYIEQGKLHVDGWYYYNDSDLHMLFSTYVEDSLLP